MLKQKYFLTGIFILSAERQPIKLAWRKIVWLQATSVPNIRVFHCDYFKVYYRVLEKQILVEAVFDTRQDPDKAPF